MTNKPIFARLKRVRTYTATIYMAGDIETARHWLRGACYEEGLCVTVTPTTFIYTGGEEAGFAVGFVNYPRFPTTPKKLRVRALALADELVRVCYQRTALVVSDDVTEWVVVDPPGMRR